MEAKMHSKLTAAAPLTLSQADDAARDYLSGWDSPDPVEATAKRGLSPVDAERLAETYGPRNARRVGRALVALCRRRSANSAAARALGARGGAAATPAQADAGRRNGRLGGRPAGGLWVVEIEGVNAASAWASAEVDGKRVTLNASPSYQTLKGLATCDGRVALFPSREAARAAALACHWNNQRFDYRPARGHVRDEGVVVAATAETEWRSCQSL
ncbi:MAG: hypothetical protein RBU36_12660 [Thermoanaerobaculia bacterium]|nr:hypothetical protein [Thermoanaerobaculia bacterium]